VSHDKIEAEIETLRQLVIAARRSPEVEAPVGESLARLR
jgi:hypothetical protein